MPYRIVKGDLLEATTEYIMQQNCCTAVRAHGLSKAIAAKWPEVNPYKERRAHKGNWAVKEDRPEPGSILVYEFEEGSGATGPKGDTGAQGEPGPKGDKGDPGDASNIASTNTAGVVKIGDPEVTHINIALDGTISVPKGAGINKVVDISDVNSPSLEAGSVLVYNTISQRWDTETSLSQQIMDGGQY